MERNLREPRIQAHRRLHRLHDVNRRHGAHRYEPYPRERIPQQQNQAHPQYYQYHWETENNRWIWMRPCRNNRTRVRCIVCRITFSATITRVEGHERIDDHVAFMRLIHVPFDPEFDPHLTLDQFYDEEARIKLKLSVWFSDEGVAYKKLDTLLPVIKDIARYPGVLQELQFTRTEMSKIISRVIAPSHKRDLAETLSQVKFSTLFDESTSISKDKHGCLLIRFPDHRSYKITTTMWDLIPIYREDNEHNNETAEAIYNLIIDSLFDPENAWNEHRALLEPDNYMASGTDGCNTMVGVHNSVAQRLLVDFPGINNIICPCHGAHLCASHAIVVLAIVIQLLRMIYNWFLSAKRMHALTRNQIQLNLDVHRLLRFVEVRWLTGLPALIRLEEQIEAIDATLAENPDNAQAMQLLALLREPLIRCFIAFLTFILEVVEDLNGWLQTEEVILPEIFERITTDFKDILLCYMDEAFVENADLMNLDIEDENHFLADDAMRKGVEARELAQQLPVNEYAVAMRMMREYLIFLATEWMDRLLIPWARFQCVEALLMTNALSEEYHREHEDIIHELVTQFPRAIPTGTNEAVLERQWRELLENEQELVIPPDVTTDYFWFVVRSIDNGEEIYPYRELADFALNVLSTPHSNAQPERIWSLEKYNRLSLASVRSILSIKEMLILLGISKNVHKFIPTPEMIANVRFRWFDNQEENPQG